MATAEKYLTRTYGAVMAQEMIRNNSLSEMDRKMIASMDRLQHAYATCKEKKVHTVLIEYQRQPICTEQVSKTKTNEIKKISNIKKECRAIKMNGEKCTAKTKCGEFCARHSKK